ncbi:hypothetical protein DFJ77DRAFT_116145 [Powellomyces hirtus]|nr:hypothetical protein DFJ77DRAFT_116145 [Powellomyces hirtus]
MQPQNPVSIVQAFHPKRNSFETMLNEDLCKRFRQFGDTLSSADHVVLNIFKTTTANRAEVQKLYDAGKGVYVENLTVFRGCCPTDPCRDGRRKHGCYSTSISHRVATRFGKVVQLEVTGKVIPVDFRMPDRCNEREIIVYTKDIVSRKPLDANGPLAYPHVFGSVKPASTAHVEPASTASIEPVEPALSVANVAPASQTDPQAHPTHPPGPSEALSPATKPTTKTTAKAKSRPSNSKVQKKGAHGLLSLCKNAIAKKKAKSKQQTVK